MNSPKMRSSRLMQWRLTATTAADYWSFPLFISSLPLADSLCLLLTNSGSYPINSIFIILITTLHTHTHTHTHISLFLVSAAITSGNFCAEHKKKVRCAVKHVKICQRREREGKRRASLNYSLAQHRRIFLSQHCQRAGSALQTYTHKQYSHTHMWKRKCY